MDRRVFASIERDHTLAAGGYVVTERMLQMFKSSK